MSESASGPAEVPGPLTLAPHTSRPPRTPAPGTPAPGAAPPPQRSSRKHAAPLTTREWCLRGLTLLISLAAVGVLLATYRRLLPVQKQAREVSTLVNRLSGEIALMETQTSPEKAAKLDEAYLGARSLLFSTSEALQTWFEQLRQDMVPLALDATASFGRPSSASATYDALALVPATLTLSLVPAGLVEGVQSPYERVLQFLDQLSQQEKRVDLLELEVNGGTNSITRATATLQLWAGDDSQSPDRSTHGAL